MTAKDLTHQLGGFWRNGRKTCTLTHPGVKKSFMSIFLGNNTRSASFTRQLKGR